MDSGTFLPRRLWRWSWSWIETFRVLRDREAMDDLTEDDLTEAERDA